MRISKFEECIAWQKAQDLAVRIYKSFGNHADTGFRYQITRSAISISNNITEGLSGRSTRDLNKYLVIAIGSCNEVKSMVYLAERLL
jgi:four helix bundle protein